MDMNERIAKLIEECTDRHFSECSGGFETFDKEKFAELIVRECIAVHEDDYGVDIIGDVLKKHFGVEE
jgi:hypothetical protein